MKKKVSGAMLLLCAFSFIINSAYAEDVFKNDPIIVTASRYETSVSKEGKDISVVTEDEIKKSGKKTVAEVLETIPGVTVVRKGTDGGIANIYIRGSKSGNVLLMIDGVRVADPMGIEKLYDISGLMTSNVERIEVVKGAMSSMYGAEASGGVINIITKKGTGRHVIISGEGGSNRSHTESVSVSDKTEKSSFFFSGTHYKTDGISKAKKSSSVSTYDDDGYENVSASGKVDTRITDTAIISAMMNYTDSETELDDGSYEDDPNHVYISKLFTSKGEFSHSPFTWWTYKGGAAYMSYIREDIDRKDSIDTTEDDIYTYDGTNVNFDLTSRLNILDVDVLTFGVEYLTEKGSSTSAYYDQWAPGFTTDIFREKSVSTRSFFVNNDISIFEIFFVNAGARIDDHDTFGSKWTWDASASLIIPVTGTKIKGSAGTGFRAPSLYELYSSYGNEELEPEKSFLYDAGVYQEFFDGVISIDITYFYQKYEDMIAFGTATYGNIDDEVKNKGVEVATGIKLADILSVSYGYTYLKFDDSDEQAVLKRPEHRHSATAVITPVEGLSISASYLYVDTCNDSFFNMVTFTTEKVQLDSYHKFDMNIRFALNETVTLTARGENLTDEDYEETYGYNTKRRSFYGGAEITL
ncbi:MAG TPA: TonB-dependent receptor [Spirochaetota bacterium]|nr:TonB-dependent receptor [Spirochaetota bacterium]